MQHRVSKLDASFLSTRNRSCAGDHGFAIVRVLLLQRTKSLTESISWACQIDYVECVAEKRGVDGLNETLHNLIPLLLTNTTIRKRSKAVPNRVL
jgi:hypothetical protein